MMTINWENHLKGLGECLVHDKHSICVGYYYSLHTYGAKTLEPFYSRSGWPAKVQLTGCLKAIA